MNLSRKGLKILFMNSIKVVGAFISPKGTPKIQNVCIQFERLSLGHPPYGFSINDKQTKDQSLKSIVPLAIDQISHLSSVMDSDS